MGETAYEEGPENKWPKKKTKIILQLKDQIYANQWKQLQIFGKVGRKSGI